MKRVTDRSLATVLDRIGVLIGWLGLTAGFGISAGFGVLAAWGYVPRAPNGALGKQRRS
jgi:hypothetical protein